MQAFAWGNGYVNLALKNEYEKSGSVFLYIPESDNKGKSLDDITASVNGEASKVEVVAKPTINNSQLNQSQSGRVVKINVHIAGTQTESDGKIELLW